MQASLADVREMLASLSARAAEAPADTNGPLVEAIDALTGRLLDRDARLAGDLLALGQRQAELGVQVDKLAAAVDGLVAATLERGATLPQSLRQLLARKL